MARQSTRKEIPEFAVVKRSITKWRETRKKLGPMPEELWDAAVKLAGNYGVSKVAKGVDLCYRTLRERKKKSVSLLAEQQSFVEVSVCQEVPTASDCTIEMVRPDGATMIISHLAHREVVTLAEGFWGQQ